MAGKKAREGERIRPCRRCKEPVKFIKSTWSVLAQRRQGWHWVNEDGAHHRCRDFNSSTGRRAPSKAKGNHIEIWTDGACEPNPGPGAYGVHIIWTNGRVTEYDGFDAETTNQRMELLGPIVALEHVKKRRGRIIIYSDSNYVINGITDWIENWKVNGWRNKRKQPVANRGLWERLGR